MIHPKGFDDQDARRRWGESHWRKSRELVGRMLREGLDAYMTGRETLDLAKANGIETAAAEAHVTLAADHLASIVLTINGHSSPDGVVPHSGFQPNAVTYGGYALLVLPGDTDDPRRCLVVLPDESEEDDG